MRIFSYRNKRTLRRIALIALLAVVLLGLLILARISYLGRYVVYSPNGVYFDKTQKLQRTPQTPEAPADAEDYPFETILSAAAEETDVDPNAVQLQGFYISTTMLANSVDEVRQALADADGYNAVLIDVKSPLGNFYYSTDIADAQTADADIAACDALIKELTETPDLIVIARVPAFSDPNFVAKHYSSALTTTSGDLWMDERRCYWLRPDSLDARSYLAAIALELDARGFDEVLFDNFTVPDDSSIAWDTEAITQIAALEDCAETLGANLTGSSIRLALGTTVPSVAQYASRVYITTEKANDVMTVTEDMAEVLPDPSTQLVFITTSHDTRFDASGVIRPLLGGDPGGRICPRHGRFAVSLASGRGFASGLRCHSERPARGRHQPHHSPRHTGDGGLCRNLIHGRRPAAAAGRNGTTHCGRMAGTPELHYRRSAQRKARQPVPVSVAVFPGTVCTGGRPRRLIRHSAARRCAAARRGRRTRTVRLRHKAGAGNFEG